MKQTSREILCYSYYKHIIIESQHPSYPNVKFYHVYAHLSDYSQVWVGKTVSKGELIGYSGDSGGGYAPHLHTEIRMRNNTWYDQRNPECLLTRSTANGYGGIYGCVYDSSSNFARYIRITGATKNDNNYGASRTYFVMSGGAAFPDETAYGINYYIGRATAQSVTLNYNNGSAYNYDYIYANSDHQAQNVTIY